jgi:hypothetical protein
VYPEFTVIASAAIDRAANEEMDCFATFAMTIRPFRKWGRHRPRKRGIQ